MRSLMDHPAFSAFARTLKDVEAVVRLRRLIAAPSPDLDAPMSILLTRMAHSESDLLASIGMLTIDTESREFTLLIRGNPYLDQNMQDADEGDRAWEKAMLRSHGCYRSTSGEWGRCIYAPTGYLWCALALGAPDLEPAPKTL